MARRKRPVSRSDSDRRGTREAVAVLARKGITARLVRASRGAGCRSAAGQKRWGLAGSERGHLVEWRNALTRWPQSNRTSESRPVVARRAHPGEAQMRQRVIGLALSGGGSRAAAFHLGCMRALRDLDLLDRVRVVSGVSGGSLLAALWAYGPPDFDDFETLTEQLLRRGLRGAILRRALHPGVAARNVATAAVAVASRALGRNDVLRPSNRTDGLAGALADMAFGTKVMSDVTHDVDVVLTATDLRTGNAVRFGSATSSCSRYGTIVEPVQVARPSRPRLRSRSCSQQSKEGSVLFGTAAKEESRFFWVTEASMTTWGCLSWSRDARPHIRPMSMTSRT